MQAFLDGLVSKDIEGMPLAADLVLTSPLDPEHPLIGKAAAAEFLHTRVFRSFRATSEAYPPLLSQYQKRLDAR